MDVSYCRSCAYYQEQRAARCPECNRAMVRRAFNYPEDVFGPPEKRDRKRSAGPSNSGEPDVASGPKDQPEASD